MRRLVASIVGALLFVAPVPSLAHTYTCPGSVLARAADGYFRYECVLVASTNTGVAGLGWMGTGNVNGGFVADCFCHPGCEIAAGDSERVFIQGNLVDPEQEGTAESWFALCGSGGSFYGTTTIVPHARAGVGNSEVAGLALRNQPNPFVRKTTFHYALPVAGPVSLRIYDTSGRLRAAPLAERQEAGAHAYTWKVDGGGEPELAPGVYIARLDAGGFASTRRLVITK